MRKYLLILYILLLTLTLGAVTPTSASITLVTGISGYLYHGFLDSMESTSFITSSVVVNDAFNPAGAVLNYAIKTNAALPLTVQAEISSFRKQGVANPDYVNINQVQIDGEVITPTGGKYQILSFTPQTGTVFYAHKLTVFVEQSQLSTKAPGDYRSTVSIEIVQ